MLTGLAWLAHGWPMRSALVFVAIYPLLTSAMWVATALVYSRGREGSDAEGFYDLHEDVLPLVSVVVPAFREGASLARTLDALIGLNYPRYEVLIVDDGSPDETAEVARRYVAAYPQTFGLLRKVVNEGKAMAMNDAMPLLRGEVLVVIDADARLHDNALRYIVPHFVRLPRVAAVTGNPRVSNRTNVVTELQTLEFTSIVSLLRRAQVVWGRIMTVSGVISAFRVAAVREVGLFDPSMPTEDIDLTWRLQRNFYDVRYEPRALVDMNVPPTWRALWRQRRRWTSGLAHVLRRHRPVLTNWKTRRLWPVYLEASLSIIWAHAFVFTVLLWVLCLTFGVAPPAVGIRPMTWGLLLAIGSIGQLAAGVRLDARYDPTVRRSLWLAPVYPLAYWLMMAACTVRSTLPALLKAPPAVARWSTVRPGAAHQDLVPRSPMAVPWPRGPELSPVELNGQ
ncbi:MAG: glycosyltransferase family 2 protein [Mycobacteriales bacterium]